MVEIEGGVAPLEALEELGGFDGDGFSEVGGAVELVPVAVCGKLADAVDCLLCHALFSHNIEDMARIFDVWSFSYSGFSTIALVMVSLVLVNTT